MLANYRRPKHTQLPPFKVLNQEAPLNYGAIYGYAGSTGTEKYMLSCYEPGCVEQVAVKFGGNPSLTAVVFGYLGGPDILQREWSQRYHYVVQSLQNMTLVTRHFPSPYPWNKPSKTLRRMKPTREIIAAFDNACRKYASVYMGHPVYAVRGMRDLEWRIKQGDKHNMEESYRSLKLRYKAIQPLHLEIDPYGGRVLSCERDEYIPCHNAIRRDMVPWTKLGFW